MSAESKNCVKSSVSEENSLDCKLLEMWRPKNSVGPSDWRPGSGAESPPTPVEEVGVGAETEGESIGNCELRAEDAAGALSDESADDSVSGRFAEVNWDGGTLEESDVAAGKGAATPWGELGVGGVEAPK